MNKKIKKMLLMSSLLVVVTACGNSGNKVGKIVSISNRVTIIIN